MKNILVTGSNGQLGNEIKDLQHNYPDYNFIFTDIDELDLTDKKAVSDFFNKNSVDICINCAAYTAVDKAEDEKELALLINRDTVKTLAFNCNKTNCFFIHISTDYIFNGRSYRPYIETDTPSPESYYGLTKLKGEEVALQHSNNIIIIRTSWLYSKYGNNFVKTMLRLGKEKNSLGVVVDQVGTPTYAGDLAKAILEIIGKSNKPAKDIFHFSNEGAISWYDFAKAVIYEAGISCQINPIESKDFPSKANRPFYSVLNKTKIKSTYNIEIPYWLESLRKVLTELK
jgi:dTDP-4-dehydrorhamnose reductase